jgi:hypothetical protein
LNSGSPSVVSGYEPVKKAAGLRPGIMNMTIRKNDILYIISLITAVWFSLSGMLWVYWGALFIAYPFGLLSFFIWLRIRNEKRLRTKFIPGILLVGLTASLVSLVLLLIWG